MSDAAALVHPSTWASASVASDEWTRVMGSDETGPEMVERLVADAVGCDDVDRLREIVAAVHVEYLWRGRCFDVALRHMTDAYGDGYMDGRLGL